MTKNECGLLIFNIYLFIYLFIQIYKTIYIILLTYTTVYVLKIFKCLSFVCGLHGKTLYCLYTKKTKYLSYMYIVHIWQTYDVWRNLFRLIIVFFFKYLFELILCVKIFVWSDTLFEDICLNFSLYEDIWVNWSFVFSDNLYKCLIHKGGRGVWGIQLIFYKIDFALGSSIRKKELNLCVKWTHIDLFFIR